MTLSTVIGLDDKCPISLYFYINEDYKELRALRGYPPPPMRLKTKIVFTNFFLFVD